MNMNRRITLSLIRPTGSDVPLDEALYGALLRQMGGCRHFTGHGSVGRFARQTQDWARHQDQSTDGLG